jgi:hypothetical protein
LRAGSLALKDAFLQLPARIRRVWGFSLAGPHGWIALDPSLEPVSPLRITSAPGEDLLRWLGANPRERPHIYSVLAPKDYFRYMVSGALATDVTQAQGLGLLEPGATRWSDSRLAELDLPPSWFPPVFDSAVTTGRISEEGIRRTGLPGGLWVVAGAEAAASPLVSAGNLPAGILLASAPEPATLALELVARGIDEIPPPEGFEVLRAPFPGHRLLRKTVHLDLEPGGGGEAAARAAREALEQLRSTPPTGLRLPERLVLDYRRDQAPPWAEALLAGAGLPAETSPFAGAEDPGIAFLAGLAQGAYRSLDDLERKLREARSETEKGSGAS